MENFTRYVTGPLTCGTDFDYEFHAGRSLTCGSDCDCNFTLSVSGLLTCGSD